MTINTTYPGASPEDVELNVTNKIEEELKGIIGIKNLPIAKEIKVSLKSVIQINLIDSSISYRQLRLISDKLEKTLERVEGIAQVNQ